MNIRAIMLNKKSLTLAAAALAVIVSITSWQNWQAGKAVEVKTVTVVKGTLERKVSSTGIVEAIDEQKVYADKPLTVKRLLVREGDQVLAGQALAELDTENLADLQGQLEQLRASQTLAAANYQKLTQPGDARAVRQGEVNLSEVQKSKETTSNTMLTLENTNHVIDEQIIQGQQNADLALRAIDQATITLSQLDLALGEAQKDYDRKQELFAVGGVARVELDAAKAKKDDLALQRDNQKLQVENAKTKHLSASSQLQAQQYQRKNNDLQLSNVRLTLTSLPLQEEVARLSLGELQNPLNSSKVIQDARALQAQIAAYETQIGALQNRVSSYVTVLKAPSAGVVLTKSLKEGEIANPNLPAFTIGDPQHLKISSDAPQKEAYLLKLGLPVAISGEALGDQRVTGSLSRLFPTVETKKDGASTDRILRFEATVQDPLPALRPGMSVDVDLVTLAKEDVIMVGNAAIREEAGTKIVYVASGTRVSKRVIKLGLVSDFDSEVLEGLSPGDKVVTSSSAALSDGILIKERALSKQ